MPASCSAQTPQIPLGRRRGANRRSGLRTSLLERRLWPIAPLGISSLDGQLLRKFQVSSRRTDRMAVRVRGINQEAALASALSTPGRLIPSTALFFRHLAHRSAMLSFFPSFLTMPHLTHIDVTACISEFNYPGRHRGPRSHILLLFEIVETL